MTMLNRVNQLIERIELRVLGIPMSILVKWDNISRLFLSKDQKAHGYYPEPRVYIQIWYAAPDSKTSESDLKDWKGRKWYLSEYMTDDEIIKTAYAAFEAAVKHEVLEGFKVDGVTIFNPHVDFEELIKISHKEVKRDEKPAKQNVSSGNTTNT